MPTTTLARNLLIQPENDITSFHDLVQRMMTKILIERTPSKQQMMTVMHEECHHYFSTVFTSFDDYILKLSKAMDHLLKLSSYLKQLNFKNVIPLTYSYVFEVTDSREGWCFVSHETLHMSCLYNELTQHLREEKSHNLNAIWIYHLESGDIDLITT
ncbi:hypothetical protein HXA34_05770 [Salipaludibacillus agaradhaerens]|uniref:hypothetical protein n=1 Tax=Salipaludibacillus agaradhaerens TaxID=76935 RepID=UPI002150E9C1|nr:hypothetical protein [Salipaludibacillus agaradhaerens]MCR6105797.1 hypothetical protein [Salipaludibacillus agaradhaerens]MCR6117833.1 hypothetical protein [Salipaludibacillus agaradhaerens]UJW56997.1 hypothetical protein HXZ66_05970 [Bacillus sp. A116_S68]